MSDYPTLKVDLMQKVGPAGSHFDEIDELRNKHRFFWNDHGPGYWVLTRFDDIREAGQTPDVFSNHSIAVADPNPAYRFLPSHIDPPDHVKYRQLMNAWFSPAAIAKALPALRQYALETVAEIAGLGECDFMSTYGDAYPVKAFCHLMGLPEDIGPFFVSYAKRMSGRVTVPDYKSDIINVIGEVKAYYAEEIAKRRLKLLDVETDFLSHLMTSTIDGRAVEDEEILDIGMTFTFGALDTTKSVLGWCMWHLATHEEDRRRVVSDPLVIPGAVEECLRAYPIVNMGRKVTKDVDFHGCPLKKDDMVLLFYQAANRDPEIFDNPEQVIIDRSPNRHVAFGASVHRCLGSHIARAELQVSLEEWHRRIPEYRLATDEPVLARGGQITVLELPLKWAVTS